MSNVHIDAAIASQTLSTLSFTNNEGKVIKWADVWEQAEQASRVMKGHYEAAKADREGKVVPVTDSFLQLAKVCYKGDTKETLAAWAQAWAAMKLSKNSGPKNPVPQILQDGYSVIKRAIERNVCGGATTGAGKTAIKTAQYGNITLAGTFNSLKVGIKAHDTAIEQAKAKVSATSPFTMAMQTIAELHKSNPDVAATIEAKLQAIITEAQAIPKTIQLDKVA